MTLFEEFLHREKAARALARAEAARQEADASLARIKACETEMQRLFAEFAGHLEALRNSKELADVAA